MHYARFLTASEILSFVCWVLAMLVYAVIMPARILERATNDHFQKAMLCEILTVLDTWPFGIWQWQLILDLSFQAGC